MGDIAKEIGKVRNGIGQFQESLGLNTPLVRSYRYSESLKQAKAYEEAKKKALQAIAEQYNPKTGQTSTGQMHYSGYPSVYRNTLQYPIDPTGGGKYPTSFDFSFTPGNETWNAQASQKAMTQTGNFSYNPLRHDENILAFIKKR